MIWAGLVVRVGGARNAYILIIKIFLVGKSEDKKPLGRHRRRWKNSKMYITEIGCEDTDWINVAQEAVLTYLKHYPDIWLDRLRKTMEILSYDSQCSQQPSSDKSKAIPLHRRARCYI